jgi:TRAP-type uncharacterized transport system fused permease subunit
LRSLTGWVKYALLIYGSAASLLHLYTSGYGTFEPRIQRGLHLLLLLPMIYLLYPATSKSPKDRPSFWDWIASIFCFLGPAYTVWDSERLNFRMVGMDEILPVELILGSVLVVLVVEAIRRALSRWLAVTVAVSIFYLATAPYWPGLMKLKAIPSSGWWKCSFWPETKGCSAF